MAISRGPRIVKDGLVLALDAADRNSYPGSGNTWYDLSGNNKNFTIYNNPSFLQQNGGLLQFDTSFNTYIHINDAEMATHLEYFTFSATVYPTNSTFMLFCRGGGGYAFTTRSTTMRYTNFGVRDNDLTIGAFNTNQLNHLTWRINGGIYENFINGIKISSKDISADSKSQSDYNDVVIGMVTNTADQIRSGVGFTGNLYNLKYYNRALSDAEIQQNYNTTKGRFNL